MYGSSEEGSGRSPISFKASSDSNVPKTRQVANTPEYDQSHYMKHRLCRKSPKFSMKSNCGWMPVRRDKLKMEEVPAQRRNRNGLNSPGHGEVLIGNAPRHANTIGGGAQLLQRGVKREAGGHIAHATVRTEISGYRK